MRTRHTITIAVLLIAAAVLGGFALSWRNDSLHREGVIRTAVDAHIYGHPLVTLVPFYLDVGGGGSTEVTTQAFLGIGRAYEWGDVIFGVSSVPTLFIGDQADFARN